MNGWVERELVALRKLVISSIQFFNSFIHSLMHSLRHHCHAAPPVCGFLSSLTVSGHTDLPFIASRAFSCSCYPLLPLFLESFFPGIITAPSLTSFRSPLKCRLLRKAFPDLTPATAHLIAPCPSPALVFFTTVTPLHCYFFTCLTSVSPTREFQQGRDFVCLYILISCLVVKKCLINVC